MFYRDLAARRLRYTQPNRIEESGGSALRVLKYYTKGYRITLNSYAKVIARLVSGVEFGEELQSAIVANGTVDEDYLAKILLGLLKEVDPNSVMEAEAVLGLPDPEPEEIKTGEHMFCEECVMRVAPEYSAHRPPMCPECSGISLTNLPYEYNGE
jgi:hypothetical protein